MRSVFRSAMLVVAIATATAGCGASRSPVDSAERSTIAVDNRAFTDMTVYLVESAGSRRRLGLATGLSTTVFTIPATVVGRGRELQFYVDPVGSSRTGSSNTLYVTPGQRVLLTIPPG
jgi:predicted small lipoprotein YifL